MRLAVFTGASRGIGAAMAQQAEAVCDRMLAIGRTPPMAAKARLVEADLLNADTVVAALRGCGELLDARDVWFFDCAGVLPLARFEDEGFANAASQAFAVSAITPLAIGACLASYSPHALTIVHLTSGAARVPIARWGAYGMAKAAAALAWRSFALEHPRARVHLIDPGVVDTDMQRQLRDAGDGAAPAVGTLQSPDQAAERVLRQSGFLP